MSVTRYFCHLKKIIYIAFDLSYHNDYVISMLFEFLHC